MSSTCSAAHAAAGALDSTAPDSSRSRHASATNGAADSSAETSPASESTTPFAPSPPRDSEPTASGQLTLFAEVARVRTPALPTPAGAGSRASEPASTWRPSDSSARSDLAGQRLRMFLASAVEASTGFSAQWSKRVTPLGRLWWVLSTSAPRTYGDVHGFFAQTDELPSDLQDANLWLASPAARDWKGSAASAATMDHNARPLNEQLRNGLAPSQELGTAELLDVSEWMMGYPAGWLDRCLPPTATRLFRKLLRSSAPRFRRPRR